MHELHDALTYLGPVEWSSVPTDDLEQYVKTCLTAGELIVNSVPHNTDGTPFHEATVSQGPPNAATSSKTVVASDVRAHPPHEDHEKLQKNWGRPYKYKKEQNPHNVKIWKLAGNDRHGAWFARSSVHEGLGFDRFKRAMMREFSQALTVQGAPGAGAVRGIAADRRLERIDIPGLAKLEVYELSAAFPGPVTPRDFIAMVMSSDNALSEKSAAVVNGKKHVPRHFMVLSRPVTHPDAPLRSGLVRGQYESVELIREIPLSTAKSITTTNLLKGKVDAASKQSSNDHKPAASHEAELNPVEWIMVTRSDPGGGIPRFLVDRGTPDSMLGDLTKFFDWACGLDDILHPDDDLDEQNTVSTGLIQGDEQRNHDSVQPGVNGVAIASSSMPESHPSVARSSHQANATDTSSTSELTQESSRPAGYFSGLTNALGAGIEAYAPAAVSNAVLPHFSSETILTDDSSDTSSVDSFMSAEELRKAITAPETPGAVHSTDSLSIMSGDQSEDTKAMKGMTHHEKEVHKLTRKREKLEQQLARKRMAEEQKMRDALEKEQSESGKTKEKIERELKKTEEKHRKEIEKLERKRERELRKAEEKRKKKDEQHKISLVSRERDEFRSQADLFRKENDLLRAQVAELQSQNTLMAQKLGALGGPAALQGVGRASTHQERSRSIKSTDSGSPGPRKATF